MTTIRSSLSDRTVTIGSERDGVHIEVTSDTYPALKVDRAEFIAAVEAELDVIVIDRADLPPVTVSVSDSRFVAAADVHIYDSASPSTLRSMALSHLALAEHLEANPPVDKAAVQRLVQAFINADACITGATFEDLVKAGVTVKADPS